MEIAKNYSGLTDVIKYFSIKNPSFNRNHLTTEPKTQGKFLEL